VAFVRKKNCGTFEIGGKNITSVFYKWIKQCNVCVNKSPESRIQNPEFQNPESRIQNPESRVQNPEFQDSRIPEFQKPG